MTFRHRLAAVVDACTATSAALRTTMTTTSTRWGEVSGGSGVTGGHRGDTALRTTTKTACQVRAGYAVDLALSRTLDSTAMLQGQMTWSVGELLTARLVSTRGSTTQVCQSSFLRCHLYCRRNHWPFLADRIALSVIGYGRHNVVCLSVVWDAVHCGMWLTGTSRTAKVSGQVNCKCRPRNTTANFQPSIPTLSSQIRNSLPRISAPVELPAVLSARLSVCLSVTLVYCEEMVNCITVVPPF